MICSKCKVFSVFPQKTLHLASKRFARQADIPMNAPTKIADFGRKSVYKRFFINADGVSEFIQ